MSKKKVKLPLSKTHPKLAKEAHGWDPASVTSGSSKKVKWKCQLGHTYQMLISSRTRGYGCPYCSSRKILIGFNDLATTNYSLALQAFGWDPKEISAGSSRKLEWKCEIGHIFKSTPFRRSSGYGCPVCSGKQVHAGFNDLATTHPQLAAEAFSFDPSTVTSRTRRSMKWICPAKHIYSALISQRTYRGTGCPYCVGQKLLEGYNDLFSQSPNLAAEANGWDPKKTYFRSNKRLLWKCSKGHTYFASASQRQFHKSGCPYCSGKKILTNFNDLQTLFPNLALEAHGWDPKIVSPNSHKKVSWRCHCGYVWSTSPNRRLQTTSKNKNSEKLLGCPRCAGKVVVLGENDLQSVFPEIAKEAHGWNPQTETFGSKKVKEWVCELGHLWRASISNRTGRKSGCPSCANSGFDPNEDGWLYFISQPDWEMFQIGITNAPDNRLTSHKKLGWEVLELRGPMDGHLTLQWETAILRMLKAKGADLSNSTIAGKFDGYSEAWRKSTFPVKSIKELMTLTEEFEVGKKSHRI